jgi:hypothetical protein
MSSELVKTETPNLLKDKYSKALLSTDVRRLNKYKQEAKTLEIQKKQEGDLNNIKSEVLDLKTELKEIKDLLSQLLNK